MPSLVSYQIAKQTKFLKSFGWVWILLLALYTDLRPILKYDLYSWLSSTKYQYFLLIFFLFIVPLQVALEQVQVMPNKENINKVSDLYVSRYTCFMACITNFFLNYFHFWTNRWNQSVEGLLSTGLTHLVFKMFFHHF